jgi:hypothetical protein
MNTRIRNVAIFVAGIAADETVGHWWLGLWGRNLLPLKLGWFTFTPELNWFAMAFWPVLLAAIVYFVWCRRRPADGIRGSTGAIGA